MSVKTDRVFEFIKQILLRKCDFSSIIYSGDSVDRW